MVPHASVATAWTNEPLDADTLVARADAQMYLAKRRRPDRRRPLSNAGGQHADGA